MVCWFVVNTENPWNEVDDSCERREDGHEFEGSPNQFATTVTVRSVWTLESIDDACNDTFRENSGSDHLDLEHWYRLPVVTTQVSSKELLGPVSPFTRLAIEDDRVIVEFNQQSFQLLEIEGLGTQELLEVATKTFGKELAEKRIAEDLVDVLVAAGKTPTKTVRLRLQNDAGKISHVAHAEMTKNNRRAILAARRKLAEQSAGHGLSKEQMLHVIDEFKVALCTRWAYLPVRKIELDATIVELSERIEAGKVESSQFHYELNKIIAKGPDGHARVSSGAPASPNQRYLPFLLEPSVFDGRKRYVAVLPDRSGFVEDDFPFVTTVDDLPLREWIAAASVCNPLGSSQYVERHALRELRQLPFWRSLFNKDIDAAVTVHLENATGESTILHLPLESSKPIYGHWPRQSQVGKTARKLDKQGIGYLRLISMGDEAAGHVHQAFRAAQEKSHMAMIIDVRGNGGGSRDALRTVYSYLATETWPPRVVNAAVYRLHEDFAEDHLAARFMYRADDPVWTEREAKAIREFAKKFQPEWDVPEEGFSDWHYMVLVGNKDFAATRFEGDVVVLMDAKCFSATDIFLAGLKGVDNVTLIGQASGGGSARSISAELSHGIRVRLGSMVSFQADGKLFDGHGVQPDLIVPSAPGSLCFGGDDNVLEEAVRLVRKGGK